MIARGNGPFPFHDERNIQTPVKMRNLTTFQLTIICGAGIGSPAVITGEKDNGLLVYALSLEGLDDLANVTVQLGDHRRKVLFYLRPWLIGVGRISGDLHTVTGFPAQFIVGMGDDVG